MPHCWKSHVAAQMLVIMYSSLETLKLFHTWFWGFHLYSHLDYAPAVVKISLSACNSVNTIRLRSAVTQWLSVRLVEGLLVRDTLEALHCVLVGQDTLYSAN